MEPGLTRVTPWRRRSRRPAVTIRRPRRTEGPPFSLDVNVTPDDTETRRLRPPDDLARLRPITRTPRSGRPSSRTPTSTCRPAWGLRPAAGVGLQVCTPEQFFGCRRPDRASSGTTTRSECPEGSHVGDIEVETPGATGCPIGGKAFFGPTGSPGPPDRGQPVEALPAAGGPGPADQARRGRDPVAERSGEHRLPEQAGDAVHPFQAEDGHEGARGPDEPDCVRSAGRKRSGSRATAAHGRRARSVDNSAASRCNPDTPFQPTSTMAEGIRSRPARTRFRRSCSAAPTATTCSRA